MEAELDRSLPITAIQLGTTIMHTFTISIIPAQTNADKYAAEALMALARFSSITINPNHGSRKSVERYKIHSSEVRG